MLVGATAPLAIVAVPRVQAEDGAVIVVDTDLALNNSDAVTNFTKAVLGTEKFELNIYGRPDLKEGPLPTSTVTFNKTVAMNGTPFFSLLFLGCRSVMLTFGRNERPQRLRIARYHDLTHPRQRRHKHERISLHP